MLNLTLFTWKVMLNLTRCLPEGHTTPDPFTWKVMLNLTIFICKVVRNMTLFTQERSCQTCAGFLSHHNVRPQSWVGCDCVLCFSTENGVHRPTVGLHFKRGEIQHWTLFTWKVMLILTLFTWKVMLNLNPVYLKGCASIFPPIISTNSVVSFMSGSNAMLPPGELSNINPKSINKNL